MAFCRFFSQNSASSIFILHVTSRESHIDGNRSHFDNYHQGTTVVGTYSDVATSIVEKKNKTQSCGKDEKQVYTYMPKADSDRTAHSLQCSIEHTNYTRMACMAV